MSGHSNTFAYMYQLQFDSSGNFVLSLSNNEGHSGVSPVQTNVFASDDITDPTFSGTDNARFLGDAINDQFTLSNAGGLNGTYTYLTLGLAAGASGPTDESHLGFIVHSGSNFYYITDNLVTADDTVASRTIVMESGVVEICFMPGTQIQTAAGEVAVEKLKIGDLVRTADGQTKPIRWIGRQTVAPRFTREGRLPIRVKAGALAENVPCRDLLVSADHALLVDGVLAQAGALVNGTSIVRERDIPAIFTYYHVELEDHSLILAENTPAETFIDNVDRVNFDNWREYQALYPEAEAIVEMPYARVKAQRQVPQIIRAKLAERGVSLYGERIASAA